MSTGAAVWQGTFWRFPISCAGGWTRAGSCRFKGLSKHDGNGSITPGKDSMSLKLGMVRGVFSLGAARLAANLLGAAAIVVLARLLTPEDFGIVAIASSILTIVQSCT